MPHRFLPHTLIITACIIAVYAPAAAQEDTKTTQTTLTVSAARARVASIRTAVTEIDAQIARKAPKLSRTDLSSWNDHTTWLTSVRDRLSKHADSLESTFGSTPRAAGGDMVQKMAQMNMQFLALQEAVQMESRKFNTLSNVSKTRHDTAKNSISNIR